MIDGPAIRETDACDWVHVSRLLAADAVALVKFRYHITFLNVAFGALIFAPDVTSLVVLDLLALYVSFNLLMYGGIYTLNDLADRQTDAAHPRKRMRPIAAGRVTPGLAAVFASTLIVAGLLSGMILFTPRVIACYVVVLAINLAYSLGGRDARYADLLLNALPHVVRFLMGALLVGRVPPAAHLVSLGLLAIALSCLRRQLERRVAGWETRRTLMLYGAGELGMISIGCLAGVVALAAVHADASPGFHAILLTSAAVLVGGAHGSTAFRSCLKAVWVR